jgi:hypothetical protein
MERSMSAKAPSRRWLSFSLKSLFMLILLVATYFAGWRSALRTAEREKEAAVQKAVDELKAVHEESLLLTLLDSRRRPCGNYIELASVEPPQMDDEKEAIQSESVQETPPPRSPREPQTPPSLSAFAPRKHVLSQSERRH